MARPQKALMFELETLRLEVSSSPGPVPYVWTIFFVADGRTLSVNAGGTVDGAAQVFPMAGSREDLGSPHAQHHVLLQIPADQGFFSSSLAPIPVDPALQGTLGEDLPAIFGAVIVLMEQNGYFTDGLARAGENALNTYVTQAIGSVIASLGPGHTTITPQDIDSITSGAADAVSAAVRSAASWWQEIEMYFEGHDILAGHVLWHFTQDDFVDAFDRQFAAQIASPSDDLWTIRAEVFVTDPCLADATVLQLQNADTEPGRQAGRQAKEVRSSMRRWRDSGEVNRVPSAAWWWEALSGHTAEIARLTASTASVRDAVMAALPGLREILDAPDKPVPHSAVQSMRAAAATLASEGSPALAAIATRALRATAELRGQSFYEIDASLGAVGATWGRPDSVRQLVAGCLTESGP